MNENCAVGELVFRAESGGRPFGMMVVQGGMATAMAGTRSLERRLTMEAMSWLVSQNPRPDEEVRFSVVSFLSANDDTSSGLGD